MNVRAILGERMRYDFCVIFKDIFALDLTSFKPNLRASRALLFGNKLEKYLKYEALRRTSILHTVGASQRSKIISAQTNRQSSFLLQIIKVFSSINESHSHYFCQLHVKYLTFIFVFSKTSGVFLSHVSLLYRLGHQYLEKKGASRYLIELMQFFEVFFQKVSKKQVIGLI